MMVLPTNQFLAFAITALLVTSGDAQCGSAQALGEKNPCTTAICAARRAMRVAARAGLGPYPCEDGCYENPLCCRTVSSGFKKTNSNNGNGNNICASKFQHCVNTCEAGGVYTCDSVGSDICTD